MAVIVIRYLNWKTLKVFVKPKNWKSDRVMQIAAEVWWWISSQFIDSCLQTASICAERTVINNLVVVWQDNIELYLALTENQFKLCVLAH